MIRIDYQIFFALCRDEGIPVPQTEYRFDGSRKWRFDLAWPDQKIALEIEGGVWTGGRHNRGSGFVKDIEKYNRAACLGWRVLRTVPQELRDHPSGVVAFVKSAMLVPLAEGAE